MLQIIKKNSRYLFIMDTRKKKVFIENLNFLSPQKQTAEPNTFQPIIYLNVWLAHVSNLLLVGFEYDQALDQVQMVNYSMIQISFQYSNLVPLLKFPYNNSIVESFQFFQYINRTLNNYFLYI